MIRSVCEYSIDLNIESNGNNISTKYRPGEMLNVPGPILTSGQHKAHISDFGNFGLV